MWCNGLKYNNFVKLSKRPLDGDGVSSVYAVLFLPAIGGSWGGILIFQHTDSSLEVWQLLLCCVSWRTYMSGAASVIPSDKSSVAQPTRARAAVFKVVYDIFVSTYNWVIVKILNCGMRKVKCGMRKGTRVSVFCKTMTWVSSQTNPRDALHLDP